LVLAFSVRLIARAMIGEFWTLEQGKRRAEPGLAMITTLLHHLALS
jgi:hypothetical protein